MARYAAVRLSQFGQQETVGWVDKYGFDCPVFVIKLPLD
jgi:hypothetical protein